MKAKILYEVRVSVDKYHTLEYNQITKSVDSVLISNSEDGEDEIAWFYTMFRSRKEAIKYFKLTALSATASQISITLSEMQLYVDKTIGVSQELYSVEMWDEEIPIKEIAKILRKFK